MDNNDTFHKVLSHLMAEKSLSIRKLARISGIDHATISKIMNGKRKANITHLEKLSLSLNVEITALLEAAGYHTGPKKEDILKNQDLLQTIQQLIKATDTYDEELTLDKINQEINKYKEYSQTNEGQQTIHQEFNNKLDKLSGKGPYVDKLRMMYSRLANKDGTTYQLVLMGAALLYFIVTTDLIPDYLLPIGLLDDALIAQTISQHLDNRRVL